ncbi:MAG: DUF1203 domain-containing protein [Thermoanaerobaculia bacterium]|nr:DUF1203 domain-containing protein [Thermoanaerobaculia bacterium]
MTAFRVVPISDRLAAKVRETRTAPGYGHPVHAEVAHSYGPCRSCLQVFREGEDRRLLFTFDAFGGKEHYPSPGPVFLHEEACKPFRDEGFPPELRELPLMLEAFAGDRWPLTREPVVDGAVEESIGRMLANPAVDYLHVRNSHAGCYIARVERA